MISRFEACVHYAVCHCAEDGLGWHMCPTTVERLQLAEEELQKHNANFKMLYDMQQQLIAP